MNRMNCKSTRKSRLTSSLHLVRVEKLEEEEMAK